MKFLTLIIFLIVASATANGKCGLSHLYDNSTQHALKAPAPPPLAATDRMCTHLDFNATVYSETSEHFILYYTREGVHKIAGSDDITFQKYLDTIVVKLEQAYTYYTDSLKMVISNTATETYQYSQTPPANKYAIEIVDIHHVRDDKRSDLKSAIQFWPIYGMVITQAGKSDFTHMFIENDFVFVREGYKNQPQVLQEGETDICYYYIADSAIVSSNNGSYINYATEKEKAFDVTSVHELYHAFQFKYEKSPQSLHFWYEAGATGMEDILSPTINDYWQYTESVFNLPESSIATTNRQYEYGQGLFLHYLLHNFPDSIEKNIWEHRTSNGSSNITETFDTVLSRDFNTTFDIVFNDYKRHLFFSGSRSSYDPDPFNDDMANFQEVPTQTINFNNPNLTSDTLIFSNDLSANYFEITNMGPTDTLFLAKKGSMMISLIEFNTTTSTSTVTIFNDSITTIPHDSVTAPAFLLYSFKSGSDGIIQFTSNKDELNIDSIDTGGNDTVSTIPSIKPPYPNPFNIHNVQHQAAQITFPCNAIPNGTSIKIFSRAGKIVKTISKSSLSSNIIWDGTSESGAMLPSGIYYYRADFKRFMGKIIIIN